MCVCVLVCTHNAAATDIGGREELVSESHSRSVACGLRIAVVAQEPVYTSAVQVVCVGAGALELCAVWEDGKAAFLNLCSRRTGGRCGTSYSKRPKLTEADLRSRPQVRCGLEEGTSVIER